MQSRSVQWSQARTLLIGALILLAPLAAHAVTTNVTVTGADGHPVAGQSIEIVDASGDVVAAGETRDDGTVGFDLAAGGTYRARTPDGKHVSAPFGAGKPASLTVPSRSASPAPAGEPRAWSFVLDLGGGYRTGATDTEAEVETSSIRRREIRLGPFPDSPVEVIEERVTRFLQFDGDDDVDGGFGSGAFQIMGPDCDDFFGVRPLFYGSFPTNSIDGSLLSGDAGGTPVDFDLRSYRWDLGLGAALALGHGFGAELALVYGNDRVRLRGQVGDESDSDTFHVHYLGPGLTLTKELLRSDRFSLGLFSRVTVLFPVANENQTLHVGNQAQFQYEADEQVRVVGGLRLAFDVSR